jgi:hypothetical protein
VTPVRFPRPAAGVAAITALAAAGAGVRLIGRGSLTVPLGSVDELARWAQETSPAVMAMALLRLAAFGACGYLGLTVTLFVVADAAGWRRVAALAARAMPATLRYAATGGAQLSLAAGAVFGSVNPVAAAPGTPAGAPPPATATMWQLDAETEPPPTPAATATMVHLGSDHPTAERDATSESALTPAAALQPSMDPAAATAAVETWVVGASDSFWSIAETIVADGSTSTPPSELDIGRYWRQLITANRDRLVAPDHPDLLIPGQTLVVPPA